MMCSEQKEKHNGQKRKKNDLFFDLQKKELRTEEENTLEKAAGIAVANRLFQVLASALIV